MNNQLSTYKGLIDFAIKKKLKSFKVDGFEFDLTGTDPKQAEMNAMRQEIERLAKIVNVLQLKAEMGGKR